MASDIRTALIVAAVLFGGMWLWKRARMMMVRGPSTTRPGIGGPVVGEGITPGTNGARLALLPASPTPDVAVGVMES